MPPIGACSRRPAIPSSGFLIPACWSCASGLGRCCGNSRPSKIRRRRLRKIPRIVAGESRRKEAAACRRGAAPKFPYCGICRACALFATAVVFTDHATYPSFADVTGDFIYARLQRGKDTIPTAYPSKEINAWAGRLKFWAQGKEPMTFRVLNRARFKKSRAARRLRLRDPRRQNPRAGGGHGADRAAEKNLGRIVSQFAV